MVTPEALILLGATGYFLAWLAHDNARIGIGEWRTPPALVRRLLRFGDGSIYAAGTAFEVWSLAVLVMGLVTMVSTFDAGLEARLLAASLYSVLLVGVVWAALLVADWVRRRR